MKELIFGTAGIPIGTEPRNTANGIKHVKSLGLGCMELEFVHSVNISKEKAPGIQEVMKKEGVLLTCHGQYYINLNAKEEKKLEASKKRVINAATVAYLCGAHSVTFHPAFYLGMEGSTVYSNVKKALKEILKDLKDKGIAIRISPETTGKPTQFGSYQDLLKMSEEIDIQPCFDFSHIHARTNGKYNTADEFREILSDVEKSLGKDGLNNMHIHLSGIAYGEKGEKNHLILEDSDLRYRDLVKVWKEFKIKGCVICESPNIEEDALLLQKTWKSLR